MADSTKATLDSKITIPKDVVFREIAGEAVILNLQTGKYFGLDEVGTQMWQALAKHAEIKLALEDLAAEYETTKDQLEHDLLELVDNLAVHQLIGINGT